MIIFLENILDEAAMWPDKRSELYGMCDDKFVFNEAFYMRQNIIIYSVASSPVPVEELVYEKRSFSSMGRVTLQ